ncbi:hypothetical protein DESC_850005 [Desulfosarcina cetonica]|nr:hypothetical protein DESC_850005 [Desulfosarcina cetonica]
MKKIGWSGGNREFDGDESGGWARCRMRPAPDSTVMGGFDQDLSEELAWGGRTPRA